MSFLFFFLPFLFLVYFLVPRKYKNTVLLVFSLLFYYFGEKWYVILLIASSTINFIVGKKIDKTHSKIYMIIGILFNLGLLIYFKYTNFFIENFNNLFGLNIATVKMIMPLGISFFTFQNLSYLVDIYRKDIKAENNAFTYMTYISLFPQLVAGPIIRYKDILEDLQNRKETIDKFAEGILRFTVGLGKKVLIADALYSTYTTILNSNMTVLSYWLVALAFTFQLYYDFSGYSDMAIGLGKMFGFDFKENFNYPLIATSITDFWHRWHISLSNFFKDYVYIPLKGNRCSTLENVRNIFVVWTLTGFWHGASWNFVIWGLYFFTFLVIEKFVIKELLKKGPISHIYTFLVVVLSFVIFSVDTEEIIPFLKGLVGIGTDFTSFESIYYLKNNFMIFSIAVIGMGPWLKNLIKTLKKGKLEKLINVLEVLFIVAIFLLSISTLISSTFNPFIYFRF